MILFYIDSNIVNLEWFPRFELNSPCTITHHIDEYVKSSIQIKIALTTHRLSCDYAAYLGFEDKINQLSAISDYVFTIESELHNFHWQIWDKCHHENVYWVLPGQVNDRDDMNKNIIFWGDWFKTTSLVYKSLPEKLAEIQPYTVKPMMFDALLGSPKPHRDFIYNAVHSNNLSDKFIMTYGGQWNNNEFYAKDYFIWEPGCVPLSNVIGTADAVEYYGVYTGLSRVIPLKVFNDTAYSIIAETDYDNTLSFFSEKTAKPMIARRLFVVFSGYKFLQNLRSFGFRTFNNVIDESYDLIKDDTQRYTAAFEQVKKLCSMDQTTVYDLIHDVVEHNFNHIMNTDWTTRATDQIRDIIKSAQAL
jgi:hypothetical protein